MSRPDNESMLTYTGRRFWPLDPRPEEIDIRDIAHGLAMTCRYGGQCNRFYSVAEHCVLVSQHVDPEYAREALLHDSSEAYIGDMIRPLKHSPAMEEFCKAETLLELAVAKRFELRSDPAVLAAVKEIDDRIVIDEMMLLAAEPDWYIERHPVVEPVGARIIGWSPGLAEAIFFARFAELFPEYEYED